VKRAIVIVGVDQAGPLPTLRDAAASARCIEEWARNKQKIEPEFIHIFTDDEKTKVDARTVKKAVRAVIDHGTIEQLIIYFAGHGMNVGYSEYWLLSEFPRDPQEAFNVRSSALLAAYCGIPHVVMISDACRTAAQDITAQRITGSELFPNDNTSGTEKPVDQFFACALGHPALEVRDPNVASKEFSALYTHVMLDALKGRWPTLLEWDPEQNVFLIRPRPLRDLLASAVSERIAALNLVTRAIQVPDAHIASDPSAWVASLAAESAPPPGSAADSSQRRRYLGDNPSLRLSPAVVSDYLLKSMLEGEGGPGRLAAACEDLRARNIPAAKEILDTLANITRFTEPPQVPQQGFMVCGASFADAVSVSAEVSIIDTAGSFVRVRTAEPVASNVLLIFSSGDGVILPAIPDFTATLTIEQGDLIDVAYEPVPNCARGFEYNKSKLQIRSLRSLTAALMRNGMFKLEGDNGSEMLKRMRYANHVDLTLAIYAAYACSDIHKMSIIRQISHIMRGDLGKPVFDVALLGGELDGKRVSRDSTVLGLAPLLTQGWPAASARRVALSSVLERGRGIKPSLWTIYDKAAVAHLRSAFNTIDV
jgi:hypothetical protein